MEREGKNETCICQAGGNETEKCKSFYQSVDQTCGKHNQSLDKTCAQKSNCICVTGKDKNEGGINNTDG